MAQLFELGRKTVLYDELGESGVMPPPERHEFPRDLGERLRIARESARLTQAEAAESIGLARTTLVAIEAGQRRLKIHEVQQLAKLYGTTANALLRFEAPAINLLPQFRRTIGAEDIAADKAASLLNTLAKAELELESILGVRRLGQYPPERPLGRGDILLQAEQDASELRHWLGLGNSAIQDITSILELQVGARVFVRRLDAAISGLFAFDAAAGPCILINANHPRYRRNLTTAHELGHFIATRKTPEVLHEGTNDGIRAERYANAFARSFLMPGRALRQKFESVTAGSAKLNRRHVIILAHSFQVSREALVRRLEEVGLARRGTWEWFDANGGISQQQAKQVLGDSAVDDMEKLDADRPLSLKLSLLAQEVWQRDLLTEGQLSGLLRIDRVELRKSIDYLDIEGSETDGSAELPD